MLEQLSAQDHYDFGMRAVKSVITAAGNLKRDFPDENEEVLLLRGLMDVNTAQVPRARLPLFEGIISDLFPGISKPEGDYGDLRRRIWSSRAPKLAAAGPAFMGKVIQIYEMTVVRHGLMLVGSHGRRQDDVLSHARGRR